jgi:hypothetical protein
MGKTYKFFRKETKEWEEVASELWGWIAEFDDGSQLKQYDQTGFFHQLVEIDYKKLHVFKIVNQENGQVCGFRFDPKRHRLIYKYSRVILKGAGLPEKRLKAFVLGYEDLPTKKKTVLIAVPTGEIILTDTEDYSFV